MNLKGVLIDFGNTLAYVDDRRYREEIISIFARYGHKKTLEYLTPLLYNAYRNIAKGEVKNINEFWKLFLKNLSIPENPVIVLELIKAWNRNAVNLFRLYNEAIPVLSALKKRYKLALVSNCSVGLYEILKAMGLTRFFKCIILSYKVGLRKPDKSIYLEALIKIKLSPEVCIFVSDEISDLEGAREVGLKTLLVHQGEHTTQKAKDPNFKPDFQCKHISEITKFL